MLIANVAGAMVRLRLTDWLCAGLPESVTLKVSGVLVMAADGVPVMAPVEALRLRPAGRVPLVIDQV